MMRRTELWIVRLCGGCCHPAELHQRDPLTGRSQCRVCLVCLDWQNVGAVNGPWPASELRADIRPTLPAEVTP